MFRNEWMKRGLAAALGALLVLVAVLLVTAGATGDSDEVAAFDTSVESQIGEPDSAIVDAVTGGLNRPSGVVRIIESGDTSSGPAPDDSGASTENAPAPAPAPAPQQPAADNEKPVLYHDSITRHGYIVQVRGIAEDPDGTITHFTVDWGDGLVETFAPYFNEGYQKPGMKASRNFDPDDVKDTSRNIVVKVYDDQGAYVAFTETVNF